MAHAWLLNDAGEASAVREAFEELVKAARAMQPPHGRASLESLIDLRRDEWDTTFRSLAYAEERDDLQTRLNALWDSGADPYALREELCFIFLSTPLGIRDRLRENLLREADPVAVLAFELGELIDRGLRPEHVYRHMYQKSDVVITWLDKWPDEEGDTGNSATSGEPGEVPDPGSSPAKEEHLLADRKVEPGEVLPDSSWCRKVERVWSELRIPEKLPPEVDGLPNVASAAEATAMIKSVQAVAYSGLVKLRPSPPARLIFDDETQIVTLDGEPHQVDHPTAYRFFKAVAEARPARVTSKALRDGGIKFEKMIRLKNYLPDPLKRCLQGRDGKGGGYTIQLPRRQGP